VIFVARDAATGEDLVRSEQLYMRNNTLYFINVIGDATRPEEFPYRFEIFPPHYEPSEEHLSYVYVAPYVEPAPVEENEAIAYVVLPASPTRKAFHMDSIP
jgi:hypothetical protein